MIMSSVWLLPYIKKYGSASSTGAKMRKGSFYVGVQLKELGNKAGMTTQEGYTTKEKQQKEKTKRLHILSKSVALYAHCTNHIHNVHFHCTI